MGDFPHYADIILFAMIAGFLVLRLRSVLGRRTGNERRRDMFARQADASRDKIVALGQHRPPPPAPPPPPPTAPPAASVAAGLADVHAADPGFDPGEFLEGARGAFAMIVAAYAGGDKDALRPLLSDDVFKGFAAAIDERKSAGETMETRIVALKHLDIVEAGIKGSTARIALKFVSDQINVLRAHDGSVVDGDPQNALEKTDTWSFTRDTRSRDPNWVLVATGSG
ncbi:MAG TPA: Tim44/TimA family putative adaptor protein [Stellaceae bacterium]|nr:Tim44/TimA family putative adaptor protein [Stellaceae bacterium]